MYTGICVNLQWCYYVKPRAFSPNSLNSKLIMHKLCVIEYISLNLPKTQNRDMPTDIEIL